MPGVDDFALRRRHVYATILIDAETGERVDVLPGRTADLVEAWLREHPGVEHGLAEVALKEVAAHSSCWAAAGPPRRDGRHAETTAERWRQVHDLLDKGTGLLECSRRLHLSLNTVKRYARAAEPERIIRPPRYRATLVDPYRDHLRQRRAENPAVPITRLLAEIREQGYPGSMNLLYRYITQGRAGSGRPHLSPKSVTRLLLTRPDSLSDDQRSLLEKLRRAPVWAGWCRAGATRKARRSRRPTW